MIETSIDISPVHNEAHIFYPYSL